MRFVSSRKSGGLGDLNQERDLVVGVSLTPGVPASLSVLIAQRSFPQLVPQLVVRGSRGGPVCFPVLPFLPYVAKAMGWAVRTKSRRARILVGFSTVAPLSNFAFIPERLGGRLVPPEDKSKANNFVVT